MNRFFRIAFILFFLTTFCSGEVLAKSRKKPDVPQEVIHLDVEKNEQVKNGIISSMKEKETDEDLIKDGINDNIDTEFSIFDNIIDKDKDKDHPFKIEEESLFGRIYKKKLERTSIPSYLLREELTYKYKKGPVDKVQFYGAYQGRLGASFTGNDYDTTYENGFAEVGVVGDFRDKNTDFKMQLNLRPISGESYFRGMISDIYIMNTAIPHHKVIVGNSRNQIGFEGGASSYTLPFAARSQIARNFGNVRALGVRVVGNYSLADYQLALNSSDRYFHEFFPGAEFTGWVNFKPLGKTDGRYGNLIVGGGLNAGRRHENYAVGGAYVGYSYKKFAVNAEYAIADGYNGN